MGILLYQLIQMIVISHMLLLASRPSPLVVPLSIKGTCHMFLNMCCQDLKTLALLHTNTFYQYNVSYRRSSARECMHVCRLILKNILCPNLVQLACLCQNFTQRSPLFLSLSQFYGRSLLSTCHFIWVTGKSRFQCHGSQRQIAKTYRISDHSEF